ncbi:MAG: hypothetical protein J7M25_10415 [Deltaproteobacteria bacterium]|nr:hypothetical protein [Deltaproteobacteria bacterium]
MHIIPMPADHDGWRQGATVVALGLTVLFWEIGVTGCSDDSTSNVDAAVDAQLDTGPSCGNGLRELGEECDDGNNDPGDGCDPNCMKEHLCGNGTLNQAEECDGSDFATNCVLSGHLQGPALCTSQCTLDATKCNDTDDHLEAWYRLDTVSTLVPDHSGKGHGCLAHSIQAGFPGRVSESSFFDASQTAYGDCGTGDASTLDGFEEMTIEAWVQLNSYAPVGTDMRAILARNETGDPTDFVYALGVAGSTFGSDSMHPLFALGSLDKPVVGDQMLLTDRWYHVAGTYTSHTLSLYVDGVLSGQTTADATFVVPTWHQAYNTVGAMNVNGQPTDLMDGYLDDVKIWSEARSPEQICADGGGFYDANADPVCRYVE